MNPGCKKRYTIIEAVQYFSEERKCYVCRFCGRELAEIPNQNEEEEDIQAMQNKIKEQMEEEEPYRTSLLGYIRKLSGITIHFEDPEDSITKELREASMTVIIHYVINGREWACWCTRAGLAVVAGDREVVVLKVFDAQTTATCTRKWAWRSTC